MTNETAISHLQNKYRLKAKNLRESVDMRKSIGGREMYNQAELSDWRQSQLRYAENLERAAERISASKKN